MGSRATAFVVGVSIALLIVAFFIVRPQGTPGPAMRDFEAYYAAGLVANRGEDPYSRAIWDGERAIPGVDRSHDETLPFVGPPTALLLMRALALFSYETACRIWGALLAAAMLIVVFGALALARAPRSVGVLLGGAIFAGSYGPLTSDVALGQIALLSAAGIIAALILLETRAWLAAALGALVAALQPNLALVLIARAGELRAFLAFSLGAALFVAVIVAGAGFGAIARYVDLLAVHSAAERATVIQLSPAAVALGFGANETVAAIVRATTALGALTAAVFAVRRLPDSATRVGVAGCALPFILPFFHEHDFVIALLPAILCAVRSRGPALALAAVAAVASGVDWLGLAQRPNGDVQSVVLAVATALGFALLAGLRRPALCGLFIPVVVAAVSLLARAHPVPIWPDALPPHWQAPLDASVSRMWGLEQQAAGLMRSDPVWSLLRLLALVSSALLAVALVRGSVSWRLGMDAYRNEPLEVRLLAPELS